MQRLQNQVASFVEKHHLETDVAHRLLDAVSELGEVAKEVLEGSRYGSRPFAPTPHWEAELGDLLFSLIGVANLTGIDLETALGRALEKYEQRIAATSTPSSESGR